MKNTFLTLYFLLTTILVSAKGNQHSFYLNIGGDYQLNQNDIKHHTNNHDVLSMDNSTGTRICLEYYRNIPGKLFMSTGVEYKYVPQKLHLNYESNKMGFVNTNARFTDDISFNNQYTDLFIRIGYSFPFHKKVSFIDIALGSALSIPVNNEISRQGLVTTNVTDEEYNDIIMHINSVWGAESVKIKNNLGIPLKALYTMQIAYRLKPIGKAGIQCKIGFDYSSGFGGKVNRTVINYFNANQNNTGHTVFDDRFQSVGLYIGIGL